MLTYNCYCEHCGITYSYQASGFPINKYNDETYCPDCKEIMEQALSKVPLKYTSNYDEDETIKYSDLVHLKNDFGKKHENCVATFEANLILPYTNVREKYIYNNYEYLVFWEKNSPDIKTIKVLKRFNLIEKKFAEKERVKGINSYIPVISNQALMSSFINQVAIAPPKGELLFDIPFDDLGEIKNKE